MLPGSAGDELGLKRNKSHERDPCNTCLAANYVQGLAACKFKLKNGRNLMLSY